MFKYKKGSTPAVQFEGAEFSQHKMIGLPTTVMPGYNFQTNDLYKEVSKTPMPRLQNGSNNNNVMNKPTRDNHLATSDLDAFLHVSKSSLGVGILAMPDAFKNAGLLAGIIGTIIVGVVCVHCTHLLVKCSQELCYIMKKPKLTYPETMEAVFLHGANQKLARFSGFARKSLNLSLFLTYYGNNTVYVILIAATFQRVFEHNTGCHFNIRLYILALALPIVLVGSIRHMKYLVPFSALANIFLFIGITITLIYLMQDIPPLESRKLVTQNYATLPLFFSTVLLGVEGIGTILPVENSMRNPHHFLGCPGVLNIAMGIVVSLFASIGFFGYLKYGDEVDGSITLSLPHTILADGVKVLVGLAILFTYGLQFTPATEVLWSIIEQRIADQNQTIAYYVMRVIMILGTIFLAVCVPQLAPVISLVGAVGFSMLGIFFPSLAEIITFWGPGLGVGYWRLYKDILLMFLAFVALVTGSYVSIANIINKYES